MRVQERDTETLTVGPLWYVNRRLCPVPVGPGFSVSSGVLGDRGEPVEGGV
jgi:hypothetical protein